MNSADGPVWLQKPGVLKGIEHRHRAVPSAWEESTDLSTDDACTSVKTSSARATKRIKKSPETTTTDALSAAAAADPAAQNTSPLSRTPAQV